MKSLALLVMSICVLPVPLLAQAPTNRTPEADDVVSARQAREDVQLLGTLAKLGLSTEQIVKIIPRLQQIQERLQAIADRRAKTLGQQQRALADVREVLVEGGTPRESMYDAIRRALRQLQVSTQVETQKLRQEESGIEAELTEWQLGRIETREQQQARIQRVQELEGEDTAAGYIVKKLGEIRELLPDEYARVRLGVANEIALKTEGARSPRFSVYRQRVLSMMDQAYRWTVAQFQANLATLEQSVATHLEIRPEADAPSAEGLISYEQYAATLRNPRTVELLQELVQRRGGGADD